MTALESSPGVVEGRSWRRGRSRPAVTAALFLAPAAILLVLFRIAPVGVVIWNSFRNDVEWVGFENFSFLLGTDSFRESITTTLVFSAIVNPLQIFLALAIALMLVDGARRPGVWQSLNLLPIAVPLAVSALVWGVALRPTDGLVNAVLEAVGLPGQPWLTSPDQALWSIVIIASWVGVGYWSLFLVAGLHDIPKSVLEAAAVDGAGYWRTLVKIRLPLLRRPLAFVLVADTVANLLLFAPVQILTRGGPEGSTNLIMWDVYRNAFVLGDSAAAAAETVMLLGVVMLIVVLQFRLLKPREDGT